MIGHGFSLRGHPLPIMMRRWRAVLLFLILWVKCIFYLQGTFASWFCFWERVFFCSPHWPGILISCLSLLIMHRLPRVLYSYFVVDLFSVLSLDVTHALQDVLVNINRSRTPGVSVSFRRRWDKPFRNHCPIFINQVIWLTPDCFSVFQWQIKIRYLWGTRWGFNTCIKCVLFKSGSWHAHHLKHLSVLSGGSI